MPNVTAVLTGHTSPETAYVVNDYPYGFRLRCKIRYWLDYRKGKGFRFMHQTTDPRRTDAEVWNKPKASTYYSIGVMYLDEKGHTQWSVVSEHNTEGLDAWAIQFAEALTSPEHQYELDYLRRVQQARVQREALKR